ncbi:MAG: class I SAM-dependent methyltransferase [SAR202 cluster bacterium]|nr:class I SAM-dependent methyltransferase [SAR202 cluster bacterium]
MTISEQKPFPDEFFQRVDENDDALFYAAPRFVVHIDDEAINTVGRIIDEAVAPDSRILDLMSSWRTHLPAGFPKLEVVGLGMNAQEMEDNPDLDDYVIHDLNQNPNLPYEDESFDAVLLTVSVQYLTQPVEVFREVARVLIEGGPFVITFSNRMFANKAVRVWQACNDQQRMELVKMYLERAGGFTGITTQDRTPKLSRYTDPVFLVMGRKVAL